MHFKQVDAFASAPFKGNPVAVFFNADSLTTEQMADIAQWTNLSEATFVVGTTSPKADYRVRIFSGRKELPFAGHPSVGTCHAVLEAGLVPRKRTVVQECGAGLVPLTVGDRIEFQLPYAKRTSVGAKGVAECLGVADAAACMYETGPRWLVVCVNVAVETLEPDWALVTQVCTDTGADGLEVIQKVGHGYAARTFAPKIGVNEDPVCGSGAGAAAAYLRDEMGRREPFEITQGSCLGREGKITVRYDGDSIYVGGEAVTTISGEWALDSTQFGQRN